MVVCETVGRGRRRCGPWEGGRQRRRVCGRKPIIEAATAMHRGSAASRLGPATQQPQVRNRSDADAVALPAGGGGRHCGCRCCSDGVPPGGSAGGSTRVHARRCTRCRPPCDADGTGAGHSRAGGRGCGGRGGGHVAAIACGAGLGTYAGAQRLMAWRRESGAQGMVAIVAGVTRAGCVVSTATASSCLRRPTAGSAPLRWGATIGAVCAPHGARPSVTRPQCRAVPRPSHTLAAVAAPLQRRARGASRRTLPPLPLRSAGMRLPW